MRVVDVHLPHGFVNLRQEFLVTRGRHKEEGRRVKGPENGPGPLKRPVHIGVDTPVLQGGVHFLLLAEQTDGVPEAHALGELGKILPRIRGAQQAEGFAGKIGKIHKMQGGVLQGMDGQNGDPGGNGGKLHVRPPGQGRGTGVAGKVYAPFGKRGGNFVMRQFHPFIAPARQAGHGFQQSGNIAGNSPVFRAPKKSAGLIPAHTHSTGSSAGGIPGGSPRSCFSGRDALRQREQHYRQQQEDCRADKAMRQRHTSFVSYRYPAADS